jgi:hypothetical protein
MNIDIGLLYRSFQRALLFNVPRKVRVISFSHSQDKCVEILVVSEAELDQEAKDHIFTAAGEVEGDFVGLFPCKVTFEVSNEPAEALRMLDHVVFAAA